MTDIRAKGPPPSLDRFRAGQGQLDLASWRLLRFFHEDPHTSGRAADFKTGLRQPAGSFYPFAFLISSISGGTISKRSPTIPYVATSKMGASLSLLMATMVFEPFMPTMC